MESAQMPRASTEGQLVLFRPPELPVELWLAVFDHLDLASALNINLTCKHLSKIVQARIFRDLYINPWKNSITAVRERLDLFLSEERVHLVRSVFLGPGEDLDSQAMAQKNILVVNLDIIPTQAIVYTISELSSFPNLDLVRCERIRFDDLLISLFNLVPALGSLIFEECSFDAISSPIQLQLSDLIWIGSPSPFGFEARECGSNQKGFLTLVRIQPSTRIEIDETSFQYGDGSLKGISELEFTPRIHKMRLNLQNGGLLLPNLFSSFGNLRNLQELRLQKPILLDDDIPINFRDISPIELPNLVVYEGSARLLGMLAPGGALQRVCIPYDYPMWPSLDEISSALQNIVIRGATNVSSMTIDIAPMSRAFLEQLRPMFPHLKELICTFNGWEASDDVKTYDQLCKCLYSIKLPRRLGRLALHDWNNNDLPNVKCGARSWCTPLAKKHKRLKILEFSFDGERVHWQLR